MKLHKKPSRLSDSLTPLSYGQRGIFFAEQLSPGQPTFNIPLVFSLKGELDQQALHRAIMTLIEKHSILQSCVTFIEGTPYLVENYNYQDQFQELSFFKKESAKKPINIEKIIQAEITKPFDLINGPLARFILIESTKTSYHLIILIHHIICDGWSVALLCKDLTILYNDYKSGQNATSFAPKFLYKDFVLKQNQLIQDKSNYEKIEYWKNEIEKLPDHLNLPYVIQKRTSVQKPKGKVCSEIINQIDRKEFEIFCAQAKITGFSVLLSAFLILLQKYSLQKTVTVGVPFALRHDDEMENVVGFLVNTLPICVDVESSMSFNDVLHFVKQKIIKAQKNQDVPFEYIIESSRTTRRNPFFQILFIQDNQLMETLPLEGIECQPYGAHNEATKAELSVIVSNSINQTRLSFEYREDLFSKEAIESFLKAYLGLIKTLIQFPEKPIRNLRLTGAFFPSLIDNSKKYPEANHIYEVLLGSFKKYPNRAAVGFNNISLTYAELSEKVDLYHLS